ncbi:MAB_1171c family putative transporter [Streptomyces sp. NPDC048197]|uniref:MAB_1171c family putative transporter n=1 Tax=Streptomyces sp. NPDC048197 TaxID=3365511 RepID=UPI003712851A
MSTLSLYELGSRIELFGAAALWLVIILRLPAARHSHQQKMLLLAVVGIAGSITVYLDPVTAVVNRSLTFAQSCGLFMNAWGVLSSALILDFVLAAMSRRRPWLIYGPMIITIVALITLNFTIAPHAGCVTTQAVPWYSPFWWILVAAHLVGTVPCAVLCVRYGRQAHDDRSLRTGLLLLAAGFTSSSLFWCVVLAFLLARPAWLGALFPLNIGVTAWLMTAGVFLPLALTIRRAARDARALWCLSPLWRDLTEAVPHVTLERPHRRIRAVVGSPQVIRLRLYRQVIEILDVLLVLQDYVRPEVVERARRHVTEHGVAEEHLEPAVTACWLQSALQAVAAAGAAQPNPLTPVNLKDDGLRSESDFLLAVLRARTLPAVRSFVHSTAAPAPAPSPSPSSAPSPASAMPDGRDHPTPTKTTT